jgi:pSer/pThr/pTyr-binding forkhead associated (FHA) protein
VDVKLVIEAGPTRTKYINLRAAETVIGRQKGCDIRIPSSTVSRRHCLLRFQDGCLTAEDLESANGTFLNGQRLMSREVVRPGDRLKIGPLVFVISYKLSPEAVRGLQKGDAAAAEEVPAGPGIVECVPVVDEEPDTVQVELTPVTPDDETEAYQQPLLLDDAEPLILPEAGELRDILSHLDEK